MKNKHFDRLIKDLVKPVTTLVNINDSIEQALSSLQLKHVDHKVIYFYVVDENKKLLGIVPTRKLLLCDRTSKISEIMNPYVVRLTKNQSLKEALELFNEYNFLAIPVVDDEGYLIGSIDVETCMEESYDIANARHREDIFQLIGLSLEEIKTANIFKNFRFRMPWVMCNMIGGVLCAIISRIFELVLGKILVLAMFIPLVLTLSESTSMQAAIQSIHFLRSSKGSWKFAFLRSVKEWKVLTLIALSSGVLVGIISLFWRAGILASLTIGFGIFISIIISSTFGIWLPILFHKLKLDPKVASGPVVLTLADILTTAIYLSLATWWLI